MAPPICRLYVLVTLPLLVRDCLFVGWTRLYRN